MPFTPATATVIDSKGSVAMQAVATHADAGNVELTKLLKSLGCDDIKTVILAIPTTGGRWRTRLSPYRNQGNVINRPSAAVPQSPVALKNQDDRHEQRNIKLHLLLHQQLPKRRRA